ncbi:ornithine carbamoyltransferase [Jatrophihabitans fulvus]
MNHRSPGCLLKEVDLTRPEFLGLVALAARLKAEKREGREVPTLRGRSIALVFEKNSTRTRCAFEVAAYDQGAHVTYIGPDGSHLGIKESARDTARVLGRMYDGIEYRGFAQTTVEELADHAGVPVWNGLTDEWHPTQSLADVLTLTEHVAKPIERMSLTYLGDGRNNVARSLLVTGALLGMDVRIGAPATLQPPGDVVAAARQRAADSGARLLVTDDVAAAVRDADAVYTDVWVSMGEAPETWDVRVEQLRDYRVTEDVMAQAAPGAIFLHCLPALHDTATVAGELAEKRYGLHGVEVTDGVFESPRSVVFDQAENRLHTIKAVMVQALAGRR